MNKKHKKNFICVNAYDLQKEKKKKNSLENQQRYSIPLIIYDFERIVLHAISKT